MILGSNPLGRPSLGGMLPEGPRIINLNTTLVCTGLEILPSIEGSVVDPNNEFAAFWLSTRRVYRNPSFGRWNVITPVQKVGQQIQTYVTLPPI
jgi:hypothetical protein